MADTATFSGAMKTMFIGPIRDILPQGKVLLFGDQYANPTDFKGILPSAEGIDMVGNEFRIPMKTRRNQSVGFRSENETLPAPARRSIPTSRSRCGTHTRSSTSRASSCAPVSPTRTRIRFRLQAGDG